MAQGMLERHRFFDPLHALLDDDVRDWFVGVDRMFDDMAKKWDDAMAAFNDDVRSEIERVDDTHYRISVVTPGYARDDLSVKIVDEDELVIEGEHAEDTGKRERTSHFEQRYLLAEHMRVDDAAYVDGKLTINVSFPEPPQAKETLVTIA